MAGRDGADIPQSDWEPIAQYLAGRSASGGGQQAASGGGQQAASTGAKAEEAGPSHTLWATLSPLFRQGNEDVQNAGFFPQTWAGATWQPSRVISGRVTGCVTCHNEFTPNSNRIELVEAAARLDVARLLKCREDISLAVDAGRLIVPFGAFSAQVNPGVYRTVTPPLIYNMGQVVRYVDIGDTVLPMPFANQGAVLKSGAGLIGNVDATLDTYVINGLQGGDAGIDFYLSRNYVSNNKAPTVGGRCTVGNQYVRVGASLMSGRFNDQSGSGPLNQGLYYRIFGGDFTARYQDFIRFQFEYASRNDNVLTFVPVEQIAGERFSGYYFEGEVRVLRKPRISLLARYDTLNRDSPFAPIGSSLSTGTFGVKRITYGINATLAGGSLLMINYEQWRLPLGLPQVNLFAIRWAATF
jgi:hypothetical protein